MRGLCLACPALAVSASSMQAVVPVTKEIVPELIHGRNVANIDIAPTVMEAMGLRKPPHMDGLSFLPLAQGKKVPWRDSFLYVYYREKNFPRSPTVFALRGDRYKYITY